jgi:flagellar biosynthetic protein FliO
MVEVIRFFIVFVAVIVLARFCVKWLSGSGGFGASSGKNMTVLERTAIDRGKCLVLVKTGDKVYFLGFTEQNVTVIDTLDQRAVQTEERSLSKEPFDAVLRKLLKVGVKENKDGKEKA